MEKKQPKTYAEIKMKTEYKFLFGFSIKHFSIKPNLVLDFFVSNKLCDMRICLYERNLTEWQFCYDVIT